MGSPGPLFYENERPAHQVTVRGFYVGKFVITQAQWQAILASSPSVFKGLALPVENVSWWDAILFCEKLSAKSGRRYRLPTEAEWEYACRAGTSTSFAHGETVTTELVNFNGDAQTPHALNRGRTVPVGTVGSPNLFGLFDMHGNVWEWCRDAWHASYDGAPCDGTAWEDGELKHLRVVRGGSWYDGATHCRSARRKSESREERTFNVGFRVALDLT